jgi:hypothetical protein
MTRSIWLTIHYVGGWCSYYTWEASWWNSTGEQFNLNLLEGCGKNIPFKFLWFVLLGMHNIVCICNMKTL